MATGQPTFFNIAGKHVGLSVLPPGPGRSSRLSEGPAYPSRGADSAKKSPESNKEVSVTVAVLVLI